mgnify:FL=1
MEIKQKEDGSCDICFTQEEIKIITQNKKLHLSDHGLRHFGNMLMRIIVEWQTNFKDSVKNLQTDDFSNIDGKKPKDV